MSWWEKYVAKAAIAIAVVAAVIVVQAVLGLAWTWIMGVLIYDGLVSPALHTPHLDFWPMWGIFMLIAYIGGLFNGTKNVELDK